MRGTRTVLTISSLLFLRSSMYSTRPLSKCCTHVFVLVSSAKPFHPYRLRLSADVLLLRLLRGLNISMGV